LQLVWIQGSSTCVRVAVPGCCQLQDKIDDAQHDERQLRKQQAINVVGAMCRMCLSVNPVDSKGSYSATSNNMKLVHWPLMGGLLHLVQRGGDWAGPLLAVPNVAAHPSTASVPITILLYNGPLLCSFNLPIMG